MIRKILEQRRSACVLRFVHYAKVQPWSLLNCTCGRSGGMLMISNGQQCSDLPISALSGQLHPATIFQSYWHTIQFLCHSCMFWKKATSGLYYLFRNRRCMHGSCRERDDMEHLNSYEQGLEKRCHLVHIIGTFLLNLEMTCISIPVRRDQKRDVIWFISQELFY